MPKRGFKTPKERQIKFEKLTPIWDVRVELPDLFVHLCSVEKTLGQMMDSWVQGVPVSKTVKPFQGKNYYRLSGHARSFCLRTKAGSIVFKGTEPMSEDYDPLFKQAWDLCLLNDMTKMDHFAVLENEVYFALTTKGALSCARTSAHWTHEYFKRFHRLPRTPFPLMVFQIDQKTAKDFEKKLKPFLSDRPQFSALRTVERLVSEGLSVYVYYYPGVPLRAGHAIRVFPGSGGVGIKDLPKEKIHFDLDEAFQKWIELLSEMLAAGFLPTTPLHTGNCMQLQNLATDGGFCDIDSLEHVSRLKDDKAFYIALLYSLEELHRSLQLLMPIKEGRENLLWTFIWNFTRNKVLSLAKNQQCDKRLTNLFNFNDMTLIRWLFSL